MRALPSRITGHALMAAALAAVAALGGCATNPATGANQLMLESEAQEVQIGKQFDQEVGATLGLYPDTALQRYVQQLGVRIAATGERPALPWTFRVVGHEIGHVTARHTASAMSRQQVAQLGLMAGSLASSQVAH